MNTREKVLLLRFLGIATLAVLFLGCNDSGSSTPADETASGETEASASEAKDPDAYDVTGKWYRKPYSAIYQLEQSGTSVQGRYYEPNDDTVYGDIAGTMKNNYIEMDVIVHYLTHPQDNFTAHKEGPVIDNNIIHFTITGGDHFLGQHQTWLRK